MKTCLGLVTSGMLALSLTANCQDANPTTNYNFTYSIPAWNASGAFTLSGGMIDGPDGKPYGYFRLIDKTGKILVTITPEFLDRLLSQTSKLKKTNGVPPSGKKIKFLPQPNGNEILNLRSILIDKKKMMALINKMNKAKGDGPMSLVNWSKLVSTVRGAQLNVSGTLQY